MGGLHILAHKNRSEGKIWAFPPCSCFSFNEGFFLFGREGKDFSRKGRTEEGLFAFVFLGGEDRLLIKRGLFFDPMYLKIWIC